MTSLQDLWADFGFPAGVDRFYKDIQGSEAKGKYTKDEVKEFLSKQASVQIGKAHKRPKVESSVWASHPRLQYQADLINLQRFKARGVQYALCVIDINSRYAQVEPINSRKQNSGFCLPK
jgi:hypothetical protein